jgi:hypothetical protein
MMENIEDIRDCFRERLLEALDHAAREAFGASGEAGATDTDLPRLFAALDIQVDLLVKRHRLLKQAYGGTYDKKRNDEGTIPAGT